MFSLFVPFFLYFACALVQAIPAPTAVATHSVQGYPHLRLPPSYTRVASGSRITHVPTGGRNLTSVATGGWSGRLPGSRAGWNATRASNTSSHSGVSIMTDPEFGVVIGCTKPTRVTSPFLYYTSGQAACNGGYTISTVSSIYNAHQSKIAVPTYAWETISAPATGCKTIAQTGTQDSFCTCAGDIIAGLIRGVAITGSLKGQATTVCGSIPTGYVSIPRVTSKSPKYLQPASGDCADGSITHTKCWDDLDLGDYVSWWWTTFNKHCQGLPFADCFYALSTPLGPSNCTQLNIDASCKQPSWSDFVNNWNGIRNFYVAQNIWNLNSFFINYWIAIGQAESTAQAMLGTIITTINPVKQTNVALNDVLMALSFGLGILPSVGGVISNAIVKSAYQSTAVFKLLYPEGTLGSQVEDWDTITGKIAGITQTLQASVTEALAAIQGGTKDFLPIANTGVFSSGLPALNNFKDDILTAFNTFMISQAYQARGIIITRTIDTDVHALQTNGTKLWWNTNCGGGYDKYGTCDTFWYDSNQHITYALTNGDSLTSNFNSDMQTLFFNYTTPELLFAGADACAQASKSSQGPEFSSSIDASTGKKFSASCLSNMKVCTWNRTPDGEQSKLLLDCKYNDVIPRLGISGCIGDDDSGTSYNVPRSYLGWGIIKDDITNNIDMSFCNNVDV